MITVGSMIRIRTFKGHIVDPENPTEPTGISKTKVMLGYRVNHWIMIFFKWNLPLSQNESKESEHFLRSLWLPLKMENNVIKSVLVNI